ncbi:MAG: hypothetical protein Fur003_6070 [Candidatus Dojkabacteria bacterium]
MTETIIGLILGVGISLIVFTLLKKRFEKNTETEKEALLQVVETRIKSFLPEVMSKSQEDLLKLANDKLGSEKKEIKTDLENKRGEIERLIKTIQLELKTSQESLNKSEKERTGSYEALKAQLEEQRKLTDQLKVSTEGLKNVLSNNQLRGQFGEQVAEELLKMCGFVKGINYDFNKSQETRETRPDFTIYLPDGTKINVDAKFPYKSLQSATEARTDEEKSQYIKQFERDVREKIRQVVTRDYINPDEKTVDFVILFIPNEMIFSFIYDKFNDLWKEAMEKKVIFAGPFSFTAILRMVNQAYDNFRYQSNIRDIIGHVQMFEKEFENFYTEFSKIGEKIQSLEKQYTNVSTTRTNQLRRRMEKVKMNQLGAGDSSGVVKIDEAPEQPTLLS